MPRHWRTYSFKVDLGNDDTGGERIPTEVGQLHCPSGQCDEREDVCLCEDDGAEACERSSFTPCVPEMPACGPGEMCLPGANGETRCQCPACDGSSGESCADSKPCADPAETCIGIEEPGDVGECACLLK